MREIPGLHLEQALWQKGFQFIGGVDEAGRGAWAGPVMAGAVILPRDPLIQVRLSGVRDSKKMTALQREHWAVLIKSIALACSVAQVSAAEIDEIGILPANRLAMQRAILALSQAPEYCLFDFIHWKDCPFPGERLVRGESQSLSIAAASVLAKTSRDELMRAFDEEIPGYGFGQHKGYGTALHRAAIQSLGLSHIHRHSFKIAPNITVPSSF
ncbi:MAG TPA: ribonuclease HII [Anaerolineales bacterium]|jgi:ribonuclease HII